MKSLYLAPFPRQIRFCVLHRNSRWPLKMAGKQFLGTIASSLCNYPGGQKFCRNCSLSHCLRDKCIFAFYAEIQAGCQKWCENDFWGKLPHDSEDTLGTKILTNLLYLTPFARYMHFCVLGRNSRWPPKIAGKRFLGKVASSLCLYPGGQKFVEIALSCPDSVIFKI